MGELAELPSAKKPRTAAAGSGEGVRALAEHTAVYPGDEGSLAHIAVTQFFKNFPQTRLVGASSFAEAFEAVASGEAFYAVVPIENSASGTLHKTYDLLVSHDVVIGGELGVRETYCLCAKEGVELAAIRNIFSHPNILEACSVFLEAKLAPGFNLNPTKTSTDAAQRVEQCGPDGGACAAVASREAAAKHGLRVLAEDIGNDSFLETRYILIHARNGPAASRPSPFPRDALSPVMKRSACFALRNEPGAIFKLLSCWALRGIDVLKVETRPAPSGRRAPPGQPPGIARLWDYLFYVDYAVSPGLPQEAQGRLAASLSEFSLWQCDFGAYPSLTTTTEKRAQSWDEMVDLMAK